MPETIYNSQDALLRSRQESAKVAIAAMLRTQQNKRLNEALATWSKNFQTEEERNKN